MFTSMFKCLSVVWCWAEHVQHVYTVFLPKPAAEWPKLYYESSEAVEQRAEQCAVVIKKYR